MDDDDLALRPDSPLAQVIREDLDPISVEELHDRIAVLEGEIARVRMKIDSKAAGLAAAEAAFKS